MQRDWPLPSSSVVLRPTSETYHRATDKTASGGVTLLRLPRRINEALRIPQPSASSNGASSGYAESLIVDMRIEIRDGHREMLSRPLLQALRDNVDRGENPSSSSTGEVARHLFSAFRVEQFGTVRAARRR